MAKKITVRDWEALSAYLDKELSPRDGSRLKMRIQNEPELRAALDELRRTRTVLRSQPRLRAPRNFTLSPQMAGIRAGRRPLPSAYPALRLAALLATFFFALVFIGDIMLNVVQPPQMIVQQDQQEQALQRAWPGIGGGGGGGNGGQPPAEGLVMPEAEMALEAQASEKAMEEPAMDAAPPATPPDTPLAAIDATMTATTATQTAAPEGGAPPPAEPQAPGRLVWPVLRILQATLALLAIITGLAALYLRRSAGR